MGKNGYRMLRFFRFELGVVWVRIWEGSLIFLNLFFGEFNKGIIFKDEGGE